MRVADEVGGRGRLEGEFPGFDAGGEVVGFGTHVGVGAGFVFIVHGGITSPLLCAAGALFSRVEGDAGAHNKEEGREVRVWRGM